MQQDLSQLSVLVVLAGVSVAVVQYLFTNHQASLRGFISSLEKIDFNQDNEYDTKLQKRWEKAISDYKKHTYLVDPNRSILSGLVIIFSLVIFYILISANTFLTGVSILTNIFL